MSIRYFIFSGMLFASSTIAIASDTSLFVQQLNTIHSLSADFKQKLSANHQIKTTARGHFDLLKPGRLRWETTSPMKQIVLADGKQVWVEDIDLEQVTIQAQQKALQGTPALFLSDAPERVLQHYQVKHMQSGEKDVYVLTADARQAAFVKMIFTFQHQQISSMQLFDHLEQRTELLFDHVKQNINIPMKRFVLNLPRGIDVIRE